MPFVARTPRKAWARASTQHGLPSFVLSDFLLSTASGLVRSWERPVDEPVLHEVDEVQARRALSRTPALRQRVWVLVDNQFAIPLRADCTARAIERLQAAAITAPLAWY